MQTRAVAAALALLPALALAPVHAGESAEATRAALETAVFDKAIAALDSKLKATPDDTEARFGEGLLLFAKAIQNYGIAQFTYGLQPPKGANIPLLRLPVPVNPLPREITYAAQRATLQSLLDDLAKVDAMLAGMGPGDTKIVLDLNKVAFDFTGGGKAEQVTSMIEVMTGINPRGDNPKGGDKFEVAFDRADALWLRGYVHILSATIDFFLAYDWHETFEAAGGLFYPKVAGATIPKGLSLSSLGSRSFFGDEPAFADLLALVHTAHWPVAEPARMKTVLGHLKSAIALSRENWKAIEAETDDDREWLPSPKQKNGVLPGMPITAEFVATWKIALDDFEAALDGKKLVPHWRLTKGVNLKKVFEEPRLFDMVLWATGHAAAPYTQDGPMISQENWNRWQRGFGGNFLPYAFYIN